MHLPDLSKWRASPLTAGLGSDELWTLISPTVLSESVEFDETVALLLRREGIVSSQINGEKILVGGQGCCAWGGKERETDMMCDK